MTLKMLWISKALNENLALENDELHIWRTKVSENIKNLDNYWTFLSSDEQITAKSFHFIKDRNRYIVSRAILRKLLESYLRNIRHKDILFEQTEYGKPYLANSININNIKFNLSHSGDAVIYAFTRNIDIGIDIEFINKALIIDDIIEQCCSVQEKMKLQQLSCNFRYDYFYKLWVLKESLVKAMGLGLSFDLREVSVDFSKDGLISDINIINNNKLYWTLSFFSAYNGYCSAFAAKKTIKKVLFFNYDRSVQNA